MTEKLVRQPKQSRVPAAPSQGSTFQGALMEGLLFLREGGASSEEMGRFAQSLREVWGQPMPERHEPKAPTTAFTTTDDYLSA